MTKLQFTPYKNLIRDDAIPKTGPIPQPEIRRYPLRFQDVGAPVGDYSDMLTMTTRS